jgi:hypothetical protein
MIGRMASEDIFVLVRQAQRAHQLFFYLNAGCSNDSGCELRIWLTYFDQGFGAGFFHTFLLAIWP